MQLSEGLIKKLAREIVTGHLTQVEYLAEIVRDDEERTYIDAFVFVWEEVLAAALEDAIGLEDRKIKGSSEDVPSVE